MNNKMKKLALVIALGAVLVGCAAPMPSQPVGPLVAVNTPEKIEAFRKSEEERAQAMAAAEAAKKAEAEQLAREQERLEYLKAKQKHLDSLPRGLPPIVRVPPKRRAAPKVVEPTPPTKAEAVPAVEAADAAKKVTVEPAATPAATKPNTTTPTHQSGPTFTPRRSAS